LRELVQQDRRHRISRKLFITSSLDDVKQSPQIVKTGSVGETMNFRIDRLFEKPNRVVLHLSGRIEAQALHTLWQLLDREKEALAMDLKEVGLVGRDAVGFLALCESRGIELRNCPPYVREWIDREGSSAKRGAPE
jgi:hypothetical protein